MLIALWEVTSALYICPFFYRLYFGAYSIFPIARSIDPAPLPSDKKSSMGPGFAVVGTPGSPSDVAPTKVLLPRLLGDSVRFIVRLRSVATSWFVNQRHLYHIFWSSGAYSCLPRASARGYQELSLVPKWHGDGYCTHWLDAQGELFHLCVPRRWASWMVISNWSAGRFCWHCAG